MSSIQLPQTAPASVSSPTSSTVFSPFSLIAATISLFTHIETGTDHRIFCHFNLLFNWFIFCFFLSNVIHNNKDTKRFYPVKFIFRYGTNPHRHIPNRSMACGRWQKTLTFAYPFSFLSRKWISERNEFIPIETQTESAVGCWLIECFLCSALLIVLTSTRK